MHARPVIGVPTQTLHTLSDVPAHMPASWVMSHRYVRVLAAAGAVPVMVPLLHDDLDTVRCLYDTLDGVFLPGGADIDPASYGEARHPRTERTDPPRDVVEMAFVRWAVAERKPVLGVCRGIQLMNLAAGGSLYQDVTDEYPGAIKHDYFPFDGRWRRDYLAHEVEVVRDSRLGDILDASVTRVNSMHHQGIRQLAPGLVATAVAPDGLIEAAELSGSHFAVGVQWHPEALVDRDPAMRRLFAAFLDAASEFRATRALGTEAAELSS